ncbi:Aste57867_10350 [Aphanomyces stellatus]|uniref:Aste57867_10350 protein n=1 Tax=Aphanomyces stellatus TaxID=120398 RepID=A0A485KQN6_9STRA|nr:hypothetical protein As57867_010310 [Aphanomyces stellatus]VFT87224.1 Aste57867_10350 [Aphanomyces stellatus]
MLHDFRPQSHVRMNDDEKATAISRELPYVIRAMSKGIDPKEKIKMDGPAEKAIAQKHIEIGRTRGLLWGACGGVVGLGVWRGMRSQSKLFGAFLAGSGVVVGGVYGLLSIREEFFVDILSLPDDQSAFAKKARATIEKEMPQSIILQEAYRRMGNLSANSDLMQSAKSAWEDAKEKKVEVVRQSPWDDAASATRDVSTRPRHAESELERTDVDDAPVVKKPSKNVFGFATPAATTDEKAAVAQVKPTTWDEIRSRGAASRN